MKKKVFRLLECAVCFEKFQKPICLDCGHVFCLECILSIQENSKNQNLKHPLCPLCRKAFRPRKKHFWNPCVPLVQIISEINGLLEPSLDFKFDVDLENLPEEVFQKLSNVSN